jgi:hypothetical protein
MNGNIDQFREDLRSNISVIVTCFDRFNALVYGESISTEKQLTERLAKLDEVVEQSRANGQIAYAEFYRWLEEQKLESSEKIAEWKRNRQTGQLHARADRFERCAATALEIAVLAMDEAERTVLRAILARKEAISIQVQRIDGD